MLALLSRGVKLSKKPSVAILLQCCWDSLLDLVLQTTEFEIGKIRLIRAAKEF